MNVNVNGHVWGAVSPTKKVNVGSLIKHAAETIVKSNLTSEEIAGVIRDSLNSYKSSGSSEKLSTFQYINRLLDQIKIVMNVSSSDDSLTIKDNNNFRSFKLGAKEGPVCRELSLKILTFLRNHVSDDKHVKDTVSEASTENVTSDDVEIPLSDVLKNENINWCADLEKGHLIEVEYQGIQVYVHDYSTTSDANSLDDEKNITLVSDVGNYVFIEEYPIVPDLGAVSISSTENELGHVSPALNNKRFYDGWFGNKKVMEN
jgi:hypothetical protein